MITKTQVVSTRKFIFIAKNCGFIYLAIHKMQPNYYSTLIICIEEICSSVASKELYYDSSISYAQSEDI